MAANVAIAATMAMGMIDQKLLIFPTFRSFSFFIFKLFRIFALGSGRNPD